MAGYRVRIRAAAEAELLGLPFPLRRQVNHKICGLKREPRPVGCEELGGGRCRLRLHGRRILYTIDDVQNLVTVYAIRS